MSEKTVTGFDIPIDEETTMSMLNSDPATVYRRLRQRTPIVRLEAIGRIVFTKANDVRRVKMDTEHFGSNDVTTPMQRAFGGHTLMRKDGCEHVREREAMKGTFEPSCLSSYWKSEFECLADKLLDELSANKTVDLLTAFAQPLSARYLKKVLGIQDVSDEQLFSWATALVTGAMNTRLDKKIFNMSDKKNKEMNTCFDQVIANKNRNIDYSVLSTMLSHTHPIEVSQIRTNMKICIGGAVIETRDALLSTLYGLLSQPKQIQYCIDQNDWTGACAEGLRWVAPIQASPRIVKKSLIMRGMLIPKGETVMAIQASANHDEEIWENPHLFDVRRRPEDNQTFGDGPHKCLGGDMYRMLIGQVVIPKLFARFPALSLKNKNLVDFKGFAFRGPTSLLVSLV